MAEKKKYLNYEGLERLVAKLKEGGGNDLVTQAEDETYVLKAVDGEGNLLVGFKESGEIEVPTGLTDDAYALIEALYEKMKSIMDYVKILPASEGGDVSSLIEDSTDEQYVMKAVDAGGNLLQGFKKNGEIEVPTGVTDDTYNLIEALYEKLSETVNYIKALPTSGGSDLIEDGTDSQYVMKAVDADGNLLQGVKGNGEVETPTGMTDDAYEVIVALVDKFNKLVDYVKQTL